MFVTSPCLIFVFHTSSTGSQLEALSGVLLDACLHPLAVVSTSLQSNNLIFFYFLLFSSVLASGADCELLSSASSHRYPHMVDSITACLDASLSLTGYFGLCVTTANIKQQSVFYK
ncbi:hypothetical protein Ciccas_013095 [Cichlidogyrus casuarinus]|uniref:Secreted protein n=1 Tax=Cichlidogyrus casuarinus TaxID=1844966 RepID=A0ABD2PM21_9PLAT